MKEIINKIKEIKYLKLIILLILICFSSMIIVELNSYLRNSKLEVVFLDIGQGDSILIKSPNYNNYLIDLGKSYTVSQEVYKNLSFWDNQIKALFLTHPDLDHVGGFSSLNNLKIKNIFVSKDLKYDLDQNILNKNNLKLTEVDKSLVIQEQNTKSSSSLNLEFKILNPYNSSFTDDNNNSIVNTLNFGKIFFIFTGDIDSEMEKVLVSHDILRD
jgi:competence protein ComEC